VHFFHKRLEASTDTAKPIWTRLVALSTGIAYSFSVFNTFLAEFWTSRGLEAHVYFEAAAVVVAFISVGKTAGGKSKIQYNLGYEKADGLAT
jgi:Cu2+-exporting ATPase